MRTDNQIVMFTSHHILTKDNSSDGFVLLKLLQSYLELDMYTSLTIHTKSTLAAGEAELRNFENLLKVLKSFLYSRYLFN